MNSKIRMTTNPPGSNRIPVVITCNHGVAWEEALAAGRQQPDENAAPPQHGIEIAPGGVLYMCCSWCAAHLQVNALKSLLDRGVQVTLTPVPPVKRPEFTFEVEDSSAPIVAEEWCKARKLTSNPSRCPRFSPENAADSEPKSYCRLPAGHGCSCVFYKEGARA